MRCGRWLQRGEQAQLVHRPAAAEAGGLAPGFVFGAACAAALSSRRSASHRGLFGALRGRPSRGRLVSSGSIRQRCSQRECRLLARLGACAATFRLWPAARSGAGGAGAAPRPLGRRCPGGCRLHGLSPAAAAPRHSPAAQTPGVGAMDGAHAGLDGNSAASLPTATAGASGAVHLVARSERASVSHRPSTALGFANMDAIARLCSHGLSALRQLVRPGRPQPGRTDGVRPLRHTLAGGEAWGNGKAIAACLAKPWPLALVAAGFGGERRSPGGG